MERFDMAGKPVSEKKSASAETVTIKIGGRAATEKEDLSNLLREMAELNDTFRFILIHGGGAEVSKVTEVFGLQPKFKEGVRMTSPEEMDIVDMVLAGKMNKYLVRMCNRFMNAVGISGSDGRLFTGKCISCDDENEVTCTGEVETVDPKLLCLLIENGYTPVISSTSMDQDGKPLNINADEAALAIASALPSTHLLFLSDVPGILKHEEIIRELTEESVEREITAGTISGGMIPKVRSSVEALKSGVGEIIIGRYGRQGDLNRLLAGKTGSRIRAK
jgi:acetylglutamate kinase